VSGKGLYDPDRQGHAWLEVVVCAWIHLKQNLTMVIALFNQSFNYLVSEHRKLPVTKDG